MITTKEQARARMAAEERWAFCKTYVEPRIKEASNDEDALGLLPNHEFLIRSSAKNQCLVKCRKTAYSWSIALDAIARAYTEPKSTGVIISIDEKEAAEKDKFKGWIYGVLPRVIRQEFRMSGGSEVIKFSNGSYIELSPNKPPTGKGASVYLDEFAVGSRNGISKEEILTGAIGATTHTGYIRAGSTERGPLTIFHQIVTGEQNERLRELQGSEEAFGGWEIGKFPWWASPALCVDVTEAMLHAPSVQTHDRVQRFGNHKLIKVYYDYLATPGQGLEIFQREFECIVLDDKESYFSIDLILQVQAKDTFWFVHVECGVGEVEKAKRAIDQLSDAIRTEIHAGEWAAALDVGRDHDMSELMIGHNLPEDKNHLMLRLNVTLNRMPFPQQQEVWDYAMRVIPTTKGYIDGTRGSIGRQLAETNEITYGQRARSFEFTPSNRSIVITGARSRMEKNAITLPDFEPLRAQLLSIKKKTTATGNVLFDVERNKFGHADKALSMAMLSDLFGQPDENYAFMPQVFNGRRAPVAENLHGGWQRQGGLIVPRR